MYLALALDPLKDTDLLFAQQLGVSHILAETDSVGRAPLAFMANRVRQAGLHLVGLEGLPWRMYGQAVTGADGDARAEQDIRQVCALVREAGQARIGQVGYGWGIPAVGLPQAAGRGGAPSAIYRLNEPNQNDRPDLDADKLWSSLRRFLEQILPEAEKAGVRLACQMSHPAMDLASPRILEKVGDIDKLFRLAPSASHGIDLDHGLFALEENPDPGPIIRRLSEQGRLFSARVRATVRWEGASAQGFLDQDREAVARALVYYRDSGFQGTLRPAPTPALAEDSAWGHKGYAFSIGYLRALLQSLGR